MFSQTFLLACISETRFPTCCLYTSNSDANACLEIDSPFISPISFTLVELKKSPKVEGSSTKAKSAKPIIMIRNIERSLIFANTAIRHLFNFGVRIYNLAFNIATDFILISQEKRG